MIIVEEKSQEFISVSKISLKFNLYFAVNRILKIIIKRMV